MASRAHSYSLRYVLVPSSNSKDQLMDMLSAIVLETDGEVSNSSTFLEFVSYKLHCVDGELMSKHR